MRALNNYGFYTEWGSSIFTLNPPKPDAPTNIIVSANNDFGISVYCNAPSDAGTLYVVKRDSENGISKVIGEYYDGFVDVNVPLNKNYEYTVRNYVTGYADGIWCDGVVAASGIVLRDAKEITDYVHVWENSSEFDVINEDSKSDVLVRCIGREYPVEEFGEWLTSSRSIQCCISMEDYNHLVKMKAQNQDIIFQNNNEVFRCYMEVKDNGVHASGKREVNITITRIDGD